MKKRFFSKNLILGWALLLTAIVLPCKVSAVQGTLYSTKNSEVAVQLGALKLGLVKPGESAASLTPQQLKQALSVGQGALNAISIGSSANTPENRALLQQATLAALKNPVTAPSLGLDPTKTSPAAIVAAITQRIPELAPSLVTAAVTASMAHSTDANGIVHPVFGSQPSAADIKAAGNTPADVAKLNAKTVVEQRINASESARINLLATLKANAISMNLPVDKVTPADAKTLAAIASQITQSAVNGLTGSEQSAGPTTAGLFGKTDANVVSVTQQLAVSTTEFYKTIMPASENSIVSLSKSPILSSLVGGVVSGAVTAAPSSVQAVATGVTQGYYASYLATTRNPASVATLQNNTAPLVDAFKAANVPVSPAVLTTTVNAAFTDTYNQIAMGTPFSAGHSNPGPYGVNANGLLLPNVDPQQLLPAGYVPPGSTGTTGNNAQGNTGNTGNTGTTGNTGNSSSGTPGGGFGGVPGLGTFGLSPGGSSPVTPTQGR